MGDPKKKVEEEVKADYASSLADLTFNSKPLINMLTMLAEENIAHAAVIVEAIETHLARVRTDVKLPILYLVDCIVKNVGGTYTTLFSQNIVSTFCSVFKVVEEKTRAEMFKLRQTWNEIFPPKKLYALDVQIHMVDPAWPVTAPPPNSIHLNPKFLKTNTSTNNKTSDLKKNVPVTSSATIDPKSLSMQQELIRKKKELLELQQKKLELELLQNQIKLQEQIQTGSQSGQPQNILLKPEVAKQLLPSHVLPLASSGNSSSGGNSANTMTRSRGFNAVVHNKNQVGRINPVSSSLVSASVKRPIRDPRLLRQQQQQEQQQQQTQSNTTNVQLEPKGTLLESNNKVIVSKTSVRDTTERSCDSRSNKESFLSSKNKTDSHKVKPTRPVLPAPSSPPQSRRVLPPSPSKVVKSPRAKLQQQLFDHRPKRTSPSVSGNSLGSQPKKSRSDSGRSPSGSKHHSSKKRDGGSVVVVKVKKCLSKDGAGTGTSVGASSGISTSSSTGSSKSDTITTSSTGSSSGSGSFKQNKSETAAVFKGVKGSKGRNYMRHNRATSDSPEPPPPRDVDLRMSVPDGLPPRNESALKKSGNVEVAADISKDTDLRQIVGKKRLSTEDTELPTKKSKTELLDELFGNEDTDLRQLPPINDRPPTPPPPIISTVAQKEAEEKKSSDPPQKPNLDVLRAKLAIATHMEKKLSPSQQDMAKKEDEDLRTASIPAATPAPAPAKEISNKIIISPADEKCIKEGKMSNEQGHHLMNKIIAQIETRKLREAQEKDNEFVNTSLQPISDDELDISTEEELQSSRRARDKDERHMGAPTNNGGGLEEHPIDFNMMYPNRMPFEEPHFNYNRRGMPPNWRGGRRRPWDVVPPMRPGLRPRMHPPGNWRAMGPGFDSNDTGRSQSPAPAPIHAPDQETLIVESVNQDEMKTICIDSIPREIRYYDDVAIVFMNWDDPREISFQSGARTVFFNDKETVTLSFDDRTYHDVMINGSLHQVKFGAPSREILIDGKPYECFFGGPGIVINLDNVPVSVRLEGPAPQVKIGSVKRTDLVAGKISLVIDAKRIYPVYLDGKTQMFILDGVTHTVRFVDGLKSVIINDMKINVEFGGLPKPIVFHGKKYFIRFTVLPKGVKPGHVYIRDMDGCGPVPPGPAVADESSQDGFSAGVNTSEPALPIPAKRRFNVDNLEEQDSNSNPPNILQSILHNQNLSSSLDVLSSVLSSPVISNPNSAGYQVENAVNRMNKPENVIAPSPSGLNINELFQKLVASGMVTTGKPKPPVEPVPSLKSDTDPTKLPKKSLVEAMKLVSFAKPETLKSRQNVLYDMLYSGMQCSSCGMRFPPELSLQYSQHLDWHFRQNRKGKKNIRVASSRRWYYSLSDWKSYEEIEDLEEREKSYFDQLQTEGASDETEEVEELVSVQADPEIQYSRCDVCMDIFDQFFNEEKEEWHLKNAIRVENRTYHPTCYEDYKASLSEPQPEPPALPEPVTVIDETSIPGLEIVNLDDEEEDEVAENSQDQLSVIIEEEQTKMSGDDKEPDETSPDDGRKEEDHRDDEEDDDVIINEVIPEKIVVDDDDDEEMVTEPEQPKPVVRKTSLDDNFMDIEDALLAFTSGPVKVKTEPKDPDEEEIFDLSTDDGVKLQSRTIEVPGTPSDKQDLDEPVSKNPPLPVHTVLKSSIDGNVELDSGAVTAPHAGLGAKIKINISKVMPAAAPAKEKPRETAVESCPAQPKNFLDPSQPLPPGEEPVLLNLKPALQGVELKQFPPVRRGSELTGMCSIM